MARKIVSVDGATYALPAPVLDKVKTDLSATFAARRVHIVAGLGQSNMSGRGTAFSALLDPASDQIKQFGSGSTVLTAATEPLDMHDVPSGMGPLLQFARNYSESLPEDDAVIVVPTAHGGTPLSSNATPLGWRWGVAGNLAAQAVAQIIAAKAAAESNYPHATVTLEAVLWFQGETDSTATTATTRAVYEADLDALIAGVRTALDTPDLPWIIYRMIPESLSVGTRAEIDACHQNTPYRVARTGVVPALAGLSNGDALHANAAQHRQNGPPAVAEFFRVKSGRAPVHANSTALPAPIVAAIGASLWLDTATRADTTDINGSATETGGKTWTRQTSSTGTYNVKIVSGEFAANMSGTSGGTILYWIDNGTSSSWLRGVVTAVNIYLRLAPKIVDDMNYIAVYLATSTSLMVRKYVAGAFTELVVAPVEASASAEILAGWVEAENRLIVKYQGVTVYNAVVSGFAGVTKSGLILAGVTGNSAKITEVESRALVAG